MRLMRLHSPKALSVMIFAMIFVNPCPSIVVSILHTTAFVVSANSVHPLPVLVPVPVRCKSVVSELNSACCM